MAASTASPCDGPAYRLAEPLLGSWAEYEITENGERLLGTLQVVPIAGGCGLSQRFESADASFGFVSLATVDADSGQWSETLLFSTGRTAEYRWRAAGADVVFDRLGDDPDKRHRLRATAIGEDSFVVLEESSTDGGRTWTTVGKTPTRRIPGGAPGAAPTLDYCTPHGEFVVEFGAGRVLGRYSILPKGVQGSFAGSLAGRVMTGRWSDADGQGDIVLTFAGDWASFSADYRNDTAPDLWHRGWLGALRPPTGVAAFERDGTAFRCGRAPPLL